MKHSMKPLRASGLCLKLLLAKQAELVEELRSKREIDEIRETVPDDDQPLTAQESSIAERLRAIESSDLHRVNAALERMRAGRYGNCEECGSSIPESRLKAIPWAEYCRKCEAQTSEEHAVLVGRAH